MTRRHTARALRLVVAAMLLSLLGGLAAAPSWAATYVPISGAGSTWSANALQQWAANVRQFGMTVNFQASGSSDGRRQFTNNTVDFGVSEIPYGLSDNGVVDTPPKRGYAYMPIVAGGTAFMYNLKIGSKRVTQLRLSGETIAKIFTGVITSWADPAIKRDNPGLTLPARRIVPVYRSDGSGTTAQLTLWMSKKYPQLWNAYCRKTGRGGSCGFTSQYPAASGGGMVGQAGSVGVAGYVSQATSEGAITYVEYSYALNKNFPVAKVLNASGYYVPPTAQNVAVGLLQARINDDTSSPAYLTQILDGVYDNPDRRAYPLSSYSYMVVPTKVEGSFTTAKGATLGAFAYYFLCEGQRQAPVLGYSPLPVNLVKAGLTQVRRIPGVNVQSVDITKCNNPTFSADGTNTLAKTAPQPASCDKAGPTQCDTGLAGPAASQGGSGSPSRAAGGTAADGPAGRGGGGATGAVGGPAAGPGGGHGSVVDPDTGQVVAAADGAASAGGAASALPVELSAGYLDNRVRTALMVLAAMLALAVVTVPPVLGRRTAKQAGR